MYKGNDMSHLLVETFRTILASKDYEEIYEGLYGIDRSKIAEYLTPEEYEAAIKFLARDGRGQDDLYYLTKYICKNLDDEQKNTYARAHIAGVRAQYEDLVSTKDYQHLLYFLYSFRGLNHNFEEAQILVDQVFTKDDIINLSRLYRDMEENGEANPNHFTYGYFCFAMSGIQNGIHPFQNLTTAIPTEDYAWYLPRAHHDNREYVIQLAATAPKFQHMVPEEFFVATLKDSMERVRSSRFWLILNQNERFKTLFDTHAQVLFHDISEKAVTTNQFHDVARLMSSLSHHKLLHVISPNNVSSVASACREQTGQERVFAKIFTATSSDKRLVPCFNAEQVTDIANRLVRFPVIEGEAINAPYELKRHISDNASALGNMIAAAAPFNLASGVTPDLFERAAEAIARYSNTPNSFSDLKGGARTRPDFMDAYDAGIKKVKDLAIA